MDGVLCDFGAFRFIRRFDWKVKRRLDAIDGNRKWDMVID